MIHTGVGIINGLIRSSFSPGAFYFLISWMYVTRSGSVQSSQRLVRVMHYCIIMQMMQLYASVGRSLEINLMHCLTVAAVHFEGDKKSKTKKLLNMSRAHFIN